MIQGFQKQAHYLFLLFFSGGCGNTSRCHTYKTEHI